MISDVMWFDITPVSGNVYDFFIIYDNNKYLSIYSFIALYFQYIDYLIDADFIVTTDDFDCECANQKLIFLKVFVAPAGSIS